MAEVLLQLRARDGREAAFPAAVSERLEQAQKAFELGQLSAAQTSLLDALADPAAHTPQQLGEVRLLLGKVAREHGDFEAAKNHFEAALEVAQDEALDDLEANALNQLASVFALSGDLSASLTFLERAAALLKTLGRTRLLADVLTNAGDIYRELSEYQNALESLQEAFEILKSQDAESRSAAVNLQNLGLTYAALGKFERAAAFYKDALTIAAQLGDDIIEVVSLINLGEVYLELARFADAEAAFEAAGDLSERHHLVVYQIGATEGLGNVFYKKGLFSRAKEAHHLAVGLAASINDAPNKLSGTLNLARDELATGSFGEAVSHARAALLLAERTEQPKALYEAHELLARAYKLQGGFEKAVYHLEAFHGLKERIFNDENAEKTRRLTLKIDLEKAHREAEVYRLKSELSRQAHEEAERLVRERTRELEEAHLEVVTRLAVAAEYRDDDTGEHTRRVGRTAALLAYALGWSFEETQLLYTAARLHDVGKIGVPDATLLKPGKLTDAEFGVMRTHTSIGSSILANGHSRLLRLAETIAAAHHERWDGQGYPHRLAGTDIPLAARIVAVADVLDALTHERPYKRAWSVNEALAEIERCSGTHFDPDIVTVCLAVFGAAGVLSPLDTSDAGHDLLPDLEKIAHLREDRVNRQTDLP